MERVGYLIDWELSCRLSKVAVRDHMLTVRPVLLAPSGSPDTLKGDSCFHVHQSTGCAETRTRSRG